MMQLIGKISQVSDLQQFAGKDGTTKFKRIVVIDYVDGNWMKKLAIELFGARAEGITPQHVGTEVSVQFNVSSREWNGKWYTSAVCENIGLTQSAPQSAPQSAQVQQPQPIDPAGLPF